MVEPTTFTRPSVRGARAALLPARGKSVRGLARMRDSPRRASLVYDRGGRENSDAYSTADVMRAALPSCSRRGTSAPRGGPPKGERYQAPCEHGGMRFPCSSCLVVDIQPRARRTVFLEQPPAAAYSAGLSVLHDIMSMKVCAWPPRRWWQRSQSTSVNAFPFPPCRGTDYPYLFLLQS